MNSYDKEDEEQDEEEEEEEEEEEVVQQAPPLVKRKDKKKKKDEELEPASDEKQRERGRNIRNIMGPMGKLHNQVIHIRSSANRTTWFIERAGKMIPLDNRTRWNS
jgi:hypothetical protein